MATLSVSMQGYEIDQHPLGKSVVLHLLPGVLILLVFLVFAPLAAASGLPPNFALFAAVLLALIPFELGYMLREGRIRNVRPSLRGVVLNHEHLPLWQYLVLLPVFTLWLFLGFAVLPPLDGWVKDTFFSWWPSWLDTTAPIGNLPPAVVVVMVVLGIALAGLAAPIVEEMYFRGYLLPRMSYLKGWAPLVNVVLFALYHLFTLWLVPTRITRCCRSSTRCGGRGTST